MSCFWQQCQSVSFTKQSSRNIRVSLIDNTHHIQVIAMNGEASHMPALLAEEKEWAPYWWIIHSRSVSFCLSFDIHE
jgi:hypothetical protein